MYRLDKRDRDLLGLLYADSRASFTELGKRMKLSGNSVERRMRQMRQAGVISLLFADVNLARLGFRTYRIYVKFDVFDRAMEEAVLGLFESYDRTAWGTVCEGEYDVLWRILAKDGTEVEAAMNMMVERFGKAITRKVVATTTYQAYLPWNRVLGGERGKGLPLEKATETEKGGLDGTDMRILASLYGNARATTIEMAKTTSLTPDAVAYRIRRLVKGGMIMGYTAWYDSRKMGFEYYKLLIEFRSITREKERQFLNYCAQDDNVIFINKCIGSWDIEVDIVVENTLELHRFVSEIKSGFGQIIGNHTYISVIEERMLNPLREHLKAPGR